MRVILVMIAFVVLNQALILPQPTLFRRQSDPAAPPASHLVHAVFGDTLELLGYDLDSSSGTPGQSVRVTLYWRLLKPTKLSLSAAVHLTALDNRGDWGSAVSLNPGAYNTMTWPTDRYVVDTYQLHISPDAPPYVGQLRVSVFHSQDSPPGYVDLSDSNGQISVILTNFRVSGNAPADMSSLKSTNLNFGDSLALLGYRRFIDASGKSCVTLRWQTRRDNLPDYTVMLHALDAQGQMLKVLDAPPVDGLYPTSLWLNGQVIDDAHCFDLPQNATLFVGLYRRDNMLRLPITDPSGAHLPDDSVKIDN